jgi:hypothetical protein
MDHGGHFWMFRGGNDCSLEENVVAGLPDLQENAYPNTVVQPDQKNSVARQYLLPQGYNCEFQDNSLLCKPPKPHVYNQDGFVSPLAYFWPNTTEATLKRKALYGAMKDYLTGVGDIKLVEKEL